MFSWWIHAHATFDSPAIHLCILLGNNVCPTFMSDMLGWIIRLYKLRWNEGTQTSVTPVLETEQISRPLLWTPSLLRPLKHRPVSTLISLETTSICRMGTARYMRDPRAVGTASACVVSHYFCPFWLCYLSGKLVRGKRQTWRDVGFAVRGGLFSFSGLVIKWGIDAYTLLWCRINPNFHICMAFVLINITVLRLYFINTQRKIKETPRLYIFCFAQEIPQTWRWL